MPFLEHLRELRKALRNSLLALMVTCSIAFFFSESLFALLIQPLNHAWTAAGLGEAQVNFASLTEPFWVYFELSIYAGIFLASPVIFHQLWRFVAPGLYERERRVALPFAFFSALLFTGGAVFCYLLVFPAAFRFFLSYSTENLSRIRGAFGFVANIGDPMAVKPVLLMTQYLDLATKMLLGFGVVFELPLLILFLSWFGIVTHRSLWRFNKYAIVLSFFIGAVLTPGPDIVSQLLMATPLVVLYQLSIGIAWLVTRRREAAQAA